MLATVGMASAHHDKRMATNLLNQTDVTAAVGVETLLSATISRHPVFLTPSRSLLVVGAFVSFDLVVVVLLVVMAVTERPGSLPGEQGEAVGGGRES